MIKHFRLVFEVGSKEIVMHDIECTFDEAKDICADRLKNSLTYERVMILAHNESFSGNAYYEIAGIFKKGEL